jgi:PAS domain S-box-containing protein
MAAPVNADVLVDAMVEGVVAVDADGVCGFANTAACRILGCAPHDLVGRRFHDLVHPRHARERWPHAKTLCPLGALLEMRLATAIVEERFARRDGGVVPVQFAGSPLRDGAGAVVTFSDATERMALQSELERADRISSLGNAAVTIAHEFNNVLMGIQPFLDLLLRRAAGRADMAEPLSRIGHSVQRGKQIALEILRFSRPLAAKLRPLPLEPWLRDVAADAAALLGDSYAVELDVPEPLAVHADRELLRQAFANVIANARDAMPAAGTLRISARLAEPGTSLVPGGAFAHIVITDSGCGMSEETLKHVFEPLFTTKKGRGTGLGLAVVRQIVTAHGGYVFAESCAGARTTISMFLPLLIEESV